MAYSYYIYYRVLDARATEANSCIHALLSAVEAKSGIAGRILTKRGDPDLWMEVYEEVSDDAGFQRHLEEAVCELDVQRILQPGSSRRIECFETSQVAGSLRPA